MELETFKIFNSFFVANCNHCPKSEGRRKVHAKQ